MTPVEFCAQCLTCRGKPSRFAQPVEREQWALEHQTQGHPVHLWIEAPPAR